MLAVILILVAAVDPLGKIEGQEATGAWQKGALLHAEELVVTGGEDVVIAQLEEDAYRQEVKENTPHKIKLHHSELAPAKTLSGQTDGRFRSLPDEASHERSPKKYFYAESVPKPVSVSFAIQYFGTKSNKHYTVAKVLLASLHDCAKVLHERIEVLVNVDSSRSDKQGVDAWLKHAGDDDYIFLSPNIHELRGYNRLAGASKGEVLFFMQDDRLPPDIKEDPTCKWLSEPLAVFRFVVF